MLFQPQSDVEPADEVPLPVLGVAIDVVVEVGGYKVSLRNAPCHSAIRSPSGATVGAWRTPNADVEALVREVAIENEETDVYPSMAGIQRWGVLVRIEARTHVDSFATAARVEATPTWTCEPTGGQSLEMLDIRRNDEAIAVGTESYDSLAWRAEDAAWLPRRWAPELHRRDWEHEFVEVTKCALRTTLPPLEPGDRCGMQYIVAAHREVAGDEWDGNYFAVDITYPQVLRGSGFA